MTNEEKLRLQLQAAGLRPEVILHDRTCDIQDCRCDCRAVIAVKVRADNRAGFRVSRHVVRINPDAPVKPFEFPKQVPYTGPVKLPEMPLIVVSPVTPTPAKGKK